MVLQIMWEKIWGIKSPKEYKKLLFKKYLEKPESEFYDNY